MCVLLVCVCVCVIVELYDPPNGEGSDVGQRSLGLNGTTPSTIQVP